MEKAIVNAAESAKDAYAIYRGMQQVMTLPEWDDLDGTQKGLLIWVVRWTLLTHADGQ